jgi:hypothetical protein
MYPNTWIYDREAQALQEQLFDLRKLTPGGIRPLDDASSWSTSDIMGMVRTPAAVIMCIVYADATLPTTKCHNLVACLTLAHAAQVHPLHALLQSPIPGTATNDRAEGHVILARLVCRCASLIVRLNVKGHLDSRVQRD